MRRSNRSDSGSSPPTMREAVKNALFGRRETTFEECRRCGTTIESGSATCPACGCDDIVTYRL